MQPLRKIVGILPILSLALALAACGPKVTPTPTAEPTQEPTATATLPPTETSAPTQAPEATTPADATAAPDAGVSLTLTPAAGVTLPAPPAGGSGAADVYQYVSQNVPDGIEVRPGASLNISWVVKNAGETTWTTGYALRYFSGPQGASDSYPFTKSVAPGQTLTLTLTLTAPQELGDYNTWWKLTNEQQQNFGDVNLQFTVTNTPGAAPKPTATP